MGDVTGHDVEALSRALQMAWPPVHPGETAAVLGATLEAIRGFAALDLSDVEPSSVFTAEWE